MTTLDQDQLDCRDRGSQAFRDRFTAKCEPACAGHIATMREAQKVERFRSSLTTSLAVPGRTAAKLNQAGLSLVQLQTELGKTCSNLVQTTLCFLLAFKADDEVVRIPNHHDFAACSVAAPPLNPKIEDVV